MAQQPEDAMQRLQKYKAKLIDILFCDADYVRQHAYSRFLLSEVAYNNIGDQNTRIEQVTFLLDSVKAGGDEKVEGLLELLKEENMQSTFPLLAFLKELPPTSTGTSRKREEAPKSEEIVPCKKKAVSTVTQKQLMQVANKIGKTWRKIGTMALDITEVKLQQIEEDYPRDHVERVYHMLLHWSKCQRKDATTAYLHYKLTEKLDADLVPDDIDFLLEDV